MRGGGTIGARGTQHVQSDGIGDIGTLGRGRGLQNIAQVTVPVPVQDVLAVRARGRGRGLNTKL